MNIVDLIIRLYPIVLGAIQDVKDIAETGVVKKSKVIGQLINAIDVIPGANIFKDDILYFFNPAIDGVVAGFKLVGVIKTKKLKGKYKLVFMPATEVPSE